MNDILIGVITSAVHLSGEISGDEQLEGEINTSQNMCGSFSNYAIPVTDYSGSYVFTPSESSQTVPTQYKSLGSNIFILPIPSEYVIPSGTIDISENGSYDIVNYASASVNVLPTLQSKSVTASSAGDTDVTPDEGYDGLSKATVTIPSGSITTGYQSGYGESQWYFTPSANVGTSGWLDQGTIYGTSVAFSIISSGTSVTPSTTSQTVGGQNYMMQSAITIDPIPSEFIVPSGTLSVSSNNSYDVTQYSGVDVDVPIPSGYIVPTGTLSITQNGTEDVTQYSGVSVNVQPPLQTKSSTYTPSETQITGTFSPDVGYYGLDEVDITIDPIPSQYIVPSGTLSISSNASGIDVTQYSGVDVSVAGGGGNLQSKTVNVTDWGSTVIMPDEGYDGLSKATANVPKASYSLSTYGYFNFDGGNSKWALTHWVNTSSAGWLSSGTVYGNTVYYSAVQSGVTITPSASSQTIGGENYMMQGAITVESAPLNSASKSYTPTESAQSETITPSSGNYGLDEVSVTVGAIPSNYVGSSIPRRDDDDISIVEEVDDAVVVASSGYYPSQAERIIPYVTGQQSVSYNSTTGVITATNTFPSSGYVSSGTEVTATGQVRIAHASISANGTYYAEADDNDAWTGVTVSVSAPSPILQSKSKSYTPTESAQTETITADNGYDGLSSVVVSVSAIPSNYVGSGIVRRDDTDLYGAYDDGSYDIGGPAGYYQYPFYKTVPNASIYGGYDAVVTPSITVNASGLITVGILEEQNFAFCFGSGWVNTSASTDIRVQGYSTLQLTNGNNLEYGLTDATSAMVGVGKVDSMIIE